MKKFLLSLLVLPSIAYSIYINDIKVEKERIPKLLKYLKYRAVADTIFEKSKTSSIKYYELVLEGIKDDFVSLARLSLIYSLKEIPELALYYGTNALEIYNNTSDKNRIYTLNYIELMVALSLAYSLLNNEPKSYSYLDESKNFLSKLILFKEDYQKAKELINLADFKYKSSFYRSFRKTNSVTTNLP